MVVAKPLCTTFLSILFVKLFMLFHPSLEVGAVQLSVPDELAAMAGRSDGGASLHEGQSP